MGFEMEEGFPGMQQRFSITKYFFAKKSFKVVMRGHSFWRGRGFKSLPRTINGYFICGKN